MEESGCRKKKPAENEGGPKKPMGSYFLFQKDRLDALKKEKPGLKHQEYICMMGSEWKSLDAKKKEKYEKQAATDKEKYNADK